MNSVRSVLACANCLGEGPVWSPLEERLYWFDIKGLTLHWWAPHNSATRVFDLPVRASAAAPRAGGGLLLATEQGLATFDTAGGRFDLVEPMDLGPGFRSNDGVLLGDGCFWWSSMDDDGGKRPGKIFRTSPQGVTQVVIEGIHIPNSLAMSPDGRRLYLADTMRQTIWTYDTDDLSRREVFATVAKGGPDGSCMDAEGFLWNAEWGASRIVRYAPDGRLDRVVEVPVEQPSACMFGGKDLATLYVTSAWEGLAAESRDRQPLAGALFAFEPGVKGLALPLFAG